MPSTSRVRVACLSAALIVIPALLAAVLHAQAASGSHDAAVQRMHQHLTALNNIEYAVIRGDLDDTREMSKELLAQLSMEGLPTEAQVHLGELKGAARTAGEASTIPDAAKATGAMTVACGTCHSGLNKSVTLTAPVKPPTVPAVRSQMIQHYYAVEMLSLGLEAPSKELWARGADTLRNAQVIKVSMKDEALAKDLNEAEAAFRSLGTKAKNAEDPAARAAVYGEILSSCGGCHSLHGRVFGPGLPKLASE